MILLMQTGIQKLGFDTVSKAASVDGAWLVCQVI
jgi:hypothetical protein